MRPRIPRMRDGPHPGAAAPGLSQRERRKDEGPHHLLDAARKDEGLPPLTLGEGWGEGRCLIRSIRGPNPLTARRQQGPGG